MQKAFLHELRDLVNRGEKRALLVSATGTGKTYASAFAVRELNPRRMLFLVHREQIARKAMESYRNVFGDTRTYGLVSGTSKEFDKDFVFATIWTIAKDVVLQNDNRTYSALFCPDVWIQIRYVNISSMIYPIGGYPLIHLNYFCHWGPPVFKKQCPDPNCADSTDPDT